MPTQLPDEARRRLEESQLDLRHRCWYNVQRLHKWSGRLEREGPSGEDADHYKTMGPRSLILGPIVWDGPTDKRKLEWDEITDSLRAKVRHLLGYYARELVTLVVGEWWSLGMTGAEFESRMTAVVQSALVDLKGAATDADSDLGLGLDIAAFVADINIELQAWCKDYVERYGAVVGLYGTSKAGAPPVPDEIPEDQPRESTSATEEDASGRASTPADQPGAEAGRRALVLGTAGIPSGRPPAGTFATNPKIQKLVEEQPKLSGLVSQVSQIEQARADAEVTFRERELKEQWGTWSGLHPWEDKLDLETTDCPWWVAGAEYVFRIAFAWRTHSPSTPDRTEAGWPKQVELTATWVYWNRVFVHDGVSSKKPKTDDLFGDMNAKRFANFAFLFCLRRFAEKDLDEWRQKAASLKGSDGEIANPVAEVPKVTAPVAEKTALRVTSIDGSVRWINPEGVDAEKSIWTPEDEKRISTCVFEGRAAVRSELEKIFSRKEWPALADLIEPFRRYAITVLDVYASAYQQVARTSAAYQEALEELLLPMVLRDLFGREWDRAPGEKVVRTLWQGGPDGKPEGREVETLAGNDPDPTCVFYELLTNAIEHRHRFFEPLPAPEPGELPRIGLTSLGLWQYIGLKERHSFAMAIKPYLEDRVAHWRFIHVITANDSDNTGDPTKNDASRQPTPAENTVTAQPSMARRVSAATDAPEMDSPTRIKFETGLALAEVTLAQDLKEYGPSLEIARKYVTSATLTLARCILTPGCEQPYEAIQRAYDFAEWFAAETMKTAWVWLCVFSEMNKSRELEKFNREERTEDGAPKGMTESELREWHGCLSGVAQQALDEFVPEFWKERYKYFSEFASDAPKSAESSRIRAWSRKSASSICSCSGIRRPESTMRGRNRASASPLSAIVRTVNVCMP
jgi:hypothetical protein